MADLNRQRDYAAYYVVGAVEAALVYLESGDQWEGIMILRRALARYEAANQELKQETTSEVHHA